MTPTLLLLPPPESKGGTRGDSQWWNKNLPLRIDPLEVLKIAVASIFKILQISRSAVCIAASILHDIGALLRILPNPMEVLKNAAAKIYNIFRRKLVGGKGDPFEILGLEGGKDKATIEDAVKARRKLALKYHPDRNLDNAEEATEKMQEINDAFNQVEHILAIKNGEDETDNETESDSETENAHRRQQNRNKKKGPRQKQYRDEQAEFERRMQEEMNRFKKAQRAAQKGRFKRTQQSAKSCSHASSEEKENSAPNKQRAQAKQSKGRSKTAKKRAKKKNQQRQRAKENAFVDPSMTVPSPSSNTESTPFHCMTPEKRCEIKFRSKLLSKSPIFTAIRQHTWSVLQVLCMYQRTKISDPIPSLEHDVSVTPLMIACYLGDDEAASVIIQIAGNHWSTAVLARTNEGEDCLDFAKESCTIAAKLYEESIERLQDITVRKDRANQEDIIEQHKKNLEMTRDLVERIQSLKQFAVDNKKKSNVKLVVIIILIGLFFLGGYCLTACLGVLFLLAFLCPFESLVAWVARVYDAIADCYC